MKTYYADGSLADSFNVYGYSVAQTLVQVLKTVRRRADARERDAPGSAPEELHHADGAAGHRHQHQPIDFAPIKQMQLVRFDGKTWVLFGDVMSA